MDRLVIADAHLGQRPGDTRRMADMLELAAARGVGEVIFLGDCCQYLIGMDKFWSPSVTEVLASWDTLRAAGVRLVVVEGNRDFFLDTPEMRARLDWSGLCYEFVQGGRRFRVVHGDRVNRDDHQYRFWAFVSKSGIARLFARLLPRRTAVAIVTGMEHRLANSNWKYRHRLPEEHLRREAVIAWKAGVDEILWGHFHCSWSWSRETKRARVVPAWLGEEVALLLDAEGRDHLVDAGLTPCPRDRDNGGSRPTVATLE